MTDGEPNSELRCDEVEGYIYQIVYGIVLVLCVNCMETSDEEAVNL